MSLIGWFKGTGPTGFGYDSTAEDVTDGLDLSEQSILITGSNSGLGFETARVLAKRGAHVLAAARSAQKAERTCAELPGSADPIVCELSEPASVQSCAESVRKRDLTLDAIVANAGIMALPELETKHGYELQFLTNHVGHFLLVTELIDTLADDGRVVLVSSDAHHRTPGGGIDFDNLDGRNGYQPWTFYGQSKLANLLFAKELHRRFQQNAETDRTAFAIHPGVVQTDLTRHLHSALQWTADRVAPLIMKDVAKGAATQTWAAVHPDAETYGGKYLADCNVTTPSRHARDSELAKRLWDETEGILEEIDAAQSTKAAE